MSHRLDVGHTMIFILFLSRHPFTMSEFFSGGRLCERAGYGLRPHLLVLARNKNEESTVSTIESTTESTREGEPQTTPQTKTS